MGALDLIRHGRSNFPRANNGSGATNINNGIINIPLDKVWLVDEYVVRVQVSQAFTGVPTSYDVRRFFSKMQLIVDTGEGWKGNFHAIYDLGRLTENVPAPVVTLAATSTADFTFDLHMGLDEAVGELVSALLTGKYSSLSLELTLNPDANNGFIGGTVPLVASYTVEVMPNELRDQTPMVRNDTSSGFGIVEQAVKQLSNITGGVSGVELDSNLTAGGKVRFIFLHCFDAATFGNLTDAVLLNGARISFESNGAKHYDNTSLSAIKQRNFSMRSLSAAGVIVLDFGDDPHQWPDLRNVKEPKFHLTIPASANLPAAWRIEICQVDARGLEKLDGPLRA